MASETYHEVCLATGLELSVVENVPWLTVRAFWIAIAEFLGAWLASSLAHPDSLELPDRALGSTSRHCYRRHCQSQSRGSAVLRMNLEHRRS